ncbi:hypothetical protein [Massilia phosphatilytica]
MTLFTKVDGVLDRAVDPAYRDGALSGSRYPGRLLQRGAAHALPERIARRGGGCNEGAHGQP